MEPKLNFEICVCMGDYNKKYRWVLSSEHRYHSRSSACYKSVESAISGAKKRAEKIAAVWFCRVGDLKIDIREKTP